jgi:hypothetical protein
MVGIWCLVAWMHLGRPPKVRLVELGPGRGTLMADLLRGAGSFPEFAGALEVDLVEISPALRRAQWATLQCRPAPGQPAAGGGAAAASSSSGGGDGGAQSSGGSGSSGPASSSSGPASSGSGPARPSGGGGGGGGELDAGAFAGVSGLGGAAAPVRWRASLDEVPVEGPPAIYLAHEFFDALPVHQFVKDKGGRWMGARGRLGGRSRQRCGRAAPPGAWAGSTACAPSA